MDEQFARGEDTLDSNRENAEQRAAGLAVVVGASGAIGSALCERLLADGPFARVIALSRGSEPALELQSETSIAAAALHVAGLGHELRLVIDATGFLHRPGLLPEKSWRQLDAAALAESFALNAIGPALLMKHFLPQLPRRGRAVFATLSARVGSIGDNRLGGWYGYRASKAALNQLVRTAAVELRRSHPEAVCVALHPGTVQSALSAPFAKSGLEVRSPRQAAGLLLEVISGLEPRDSGSFLDWRGQSLPW